MNTSTYQMSEAVVAPDCSMTSGATYNNIMSTHAGETRALPTPVRAANNSIVANCSGRGGTGDSEIRKLDASILIR